MVNFRQNYDFGGAQVGATLHPYTLRFPDYNGLDKKEIESYQRKIEDLIRREIFIPDLRTHKGETQVITESDLGTRVKVDSVITSSRKIALCLLTADCAPIMMHDPENNVIAAVHGSKAAIENKVIEKTLMEMQDTFSTNTSNVLIHVGPTICQTHYEINEGSAPLYKDGNIESGKPGKSLLDIRGEISGRLTDIGVQESNVDSPHLCTYGSEDLYSFRRKTHLKQQGLNPIHANNGALIWLK